MFPTTPAVEVPTMASLSASKLAFITDREAVNVSVPAIVVIVAADAGRPNNAMNRKIRSFFIYVCNYNII